MVGQRGRKVKSFLEGSRCDALNSRLETRLAHHEPLRDTMKVATERTILVHVGLPGRWSDPKNPFGEIAALVEAAGAEVVGTISQKLSKPSRQDADSQRQSARTGGGGEGAVRRLGGLRSRPYTGTNSRT